MTVKHEIKSQLAKLLATEDLIVEHRHVDTAQFNVHSRVLTLPLWEKASNIVYDMLVGHEVGHALFTPDQDPPREIPHQFINIVEDARIEKLMKRKYMGLAKTFYGGYKEMFDEDFFEIEDRDISTMNLADRANLYFKIGNYVDIEFVEEENKIIEMISKTETFADVILAAKVLYEFCKENLENEKISESEIPPVQGNSEGNSSESKESPKSDFSSEGISQEKSSDESDIISEDGESENSESRSEPEVHTAQNLEENLKNLISNYGGENIYVELPEVNLDTIVISNNKIHSETNSFFVHQQKVTTIGIYENADDQFLKFKKSAQKEVSYLLKEFECRKAADSYARTTTARTGVLDCSKLHTHKYNEDLFKKVSTLAEGKNHGLIFVLDWSGSMSNVLLDTIKQLYNLIWFCKKSNIPFEVYSFTNEWNRFAFDYETKKYLTTELQPHYEKDENLLCVPSCFSMLNIFTSKVSTKEMEYQMLNIWRIASYYHNSYNNKYTVPERMSLSGTPLNESLVSLHQILPKFQKENKLQKVQCIILTDGEASHLIRHVKISSTKGDYIGTRRLNPESCFIRDRKLGSTYKVHYDYHNFSNMMIKILRDNFPSVNFIGIRVLGSREANNFIKLYHNYGTDSYDKIIFDWRKNRSFCIKNSGYHAYFGLPSSSLSQETNFEVDYGASKSKIKSAFIKSLKTKKLNKKVLSEFISLVV